MTVSNHLILFHRIFKCFIIFILGEVITVLFNIRLKTGFFETKAYDLLIGKDKMVLSSKESGSDVITIPDKNIISITLKSEKTSEVEIQTQDKIYQCSLFEKFDFENLLKTLKENLSTTITCEYKGGQNHM